MPAPHASRTVVTRLSGCWIDASGVAFAGDAIAMTKIRAISLTMFSSTKMARRLRCAVHEATILQNGQQVDLGPTGLLIRTPLYGVAFCEAMSAYPRKRPRSGNSRKSHVRFIPKSSH